MPFSLTAKKAQGCEAHASLVVYDPWLLGGFVGCEAGGPIVSRSIPSCPLAIANTAAFASPIAGAILQTR